MAKKYLKPGDSIYSTGVHLDLQKDMTWKVMAFDSDSYSDGEDVHGESANPENNHPYIGEEEEFLRGGIISSLTKKYSLSEIFSF